MADWYNAKTRDLFQAILGLRDQKEAKKFFRDLLTEKELTELGNRWKAARMLEKEIPYTRIIYETGLSSTTIARISQWLHHGRSGYKLALERLKR